MKCEAIRNMISSYIDKDLNDIEKSEFEKHLSQCQECREEYESVYEIVAICGSLEEAELPESFRTELHHRLVETKKSGLGRFMGTRSMKVATGLVAAVLVVVVGIGSLSSLIGENANKTAANGISFGKHKAAASQTANLLMRSGAAESSYDAAAAPNTEFTTADIAPAAAAAPKMAAKSTQNATLSQSNTAVQFNESMVTAKAPPDRQETVNTGRMVIRTGNVSLKVTNVDNAVDGIKKTTEKSGGYVENSQIDNVVVAQTDSVNGDSNTGENTVKYANMTIRVPADKFDEIFNSVKGMGKLVSENVNGNDITKEYRDTYARAENLKVQEQSLQQLMAKAKSVDEILKIETELNRVRTDIDLLEGNLKQWDDLVQLST
ncbi:MAG: DUF4349 domain-containing protein, partial [Caulobacteraceae bacterium]